MTIRHDTYIDRRVFDRIIGSCVAFALHDLCIDKSLTSRIHVANTWNKNASTSFFLSYRIRCTQEKGLPDRAET